MKQLSIEEKAKAYDEALERAKELLEVGLKDTRDKRVVLSFFPELKESEDERIRKEITDFVKSRGGFKGEWIAWLEKQGEKEKFIEKELECIKGYREKAIKRLEELEKQGEQEPVMIQWKGDNLKEVVDFTGVYKEGFEKWFHNSWEEYEKYVHEHNNIFKIFNEDGSHMEVPVGAWIIKAPDGYNTASRFAISPILTEISIESNFKFKKAIEHIEDYVNSFPHSQRPEIWQHINFLKSLKEISHPKQEWSEEDEYYHNIVLYILNNECVGKTDKENAINWFKSLRHQSTWRPSKKQMKDLAFVADQNKGNMLGKTIISLYKDLTKLTE